MHRSRWTRDQQKTGTLGVVVELNAAYEDEAALAADLPIASPAQDAETT
jgi:hypothetical protein